MRLAGLVMEDKRSNPSNYAMVSISEGARMVGEGWVEYGQADAYGHKKPGGIGAATGQALKQITGQNIIDQQLSYLMRSGAPDSLDLMVSMNFAHRALSLVLNKRFGRLIAMREGRYTHAPLSRVRESVKRVDVDELYDRELYRPKVRHVDGKSLFLY